MRQKTDSVNPYLIATSSYRTKQNALAETKEYKEMMAEAEKIAARIMKVAQTGKTAEAMIRHEMHLQAMDKLLNKNPSATEQTYMKKAEIGYKMIDAAVKQMRRNPQEYFESNRSLEGVGEDIRQFPKQRMEKHIRTGITRLSNRRLDTTDDRRLILDARTVLAKATLTKLKDLHGNLLKNHKQQ